MNMICRRMVCDFAWLTATIVFTFISAATSAAQESEIHPLKPVATTSPRDTLKSFQDLMDEVCQQASSGSSAAAVASLRDAVRCLNISQLSPISAQDESFEAALMLKEILDRIEVPETNAVPGIDEVEKHGLLRNLLGSFESFENKNDASQTAPTLDKETDLFWVIPNTEIRIGLVTKGARRGEFLFTAETVERIPEFYERVNELPYRAEARPNVFRAYIATPGKGISVQWKDRMPDWATRIIAGQTVWQWILTLMLIPFAATLVLFVLRLGRESDQRGRYFSRIGTIVALVISLVIVSFTDWLLDEVVNFTGEPLFFVSTAFLCAWFGFLVLLTFAVLDACGEIVIRMRNFEPKGARGRLTRLITRLLALVAGVFILVYAASQLGLPAYSIVTGLGVGGVAAALAFQDGLKGLVGSLVIMLERPYSAGDWVILGDHQGTVEEIGYRCTLIRTFYDSVISIPNSKVASMTIDNMGRRKYRRVNAKIGISDQTPPEKVEAFLEGAKQIILANPNTRKDYFHVVLHGFSNSGLNVMLYFFLDVPDWTTELVERQRVYLEVIRLADALDVKYAPTQSLSVETTSSESTSPASEADNEELSRIARSFGDGQFGRPGGSGIFVPPYEESDRNEDEPT